MENLESCVNSVVQRNESLQITPMKSTYQKLELKFFWHPEGRLNKWVSMTDDHTKGFV